MGCSKTPDDSQPINIETPDGDVMAHQSSADAMPQDIKRVSGRELARLQSLGTRGPGFVAAYLSNTPNPDLKDYDRAFRAWQTSASPQHSKDQVVEILGAYLGNCMIADFDMEWVMVTDEYGTDYAVRGKTNDVMAFPFSSVMKRIEDGEHEFLYGVYHTLKHTLKSGDVKGGDAE